MNIENVAGWILVGIMCVVFFLCGAGIGMALYKEQYCWKNPTEIRCKIRRDDTVRYVE